MELTTVWFIAITVLWVGYFILEGFDFGVGMWLGRLGRTERDRRTILATIGPVWDGNEVWVITAGGAMFAAFPGWYATVFSGFYLPLLVILFGLIIRAVGLEFRERRHDARWLRTCDASIMLGSTLPAVLWGVAFANIVRGVPIDASQNFTGTVLDLLNPFAILGGLVTCSLFLTHGAIFLALRTTGDLRLRAKRASAVSGAVAAVLGLTFLIWLNLMPTINNQPLVIIGSVITVLGLIAGFVFQRAGRDGRSFIGSTFSVAGPVLTLYAALYPRLLPSTTDPAWSLTIDNASATDSTLTIMTWSAVVLLPLVLAYQGWTYWVFRKRVGSGAE
jgi:cytochrome d ubiquinol oxidase subunit II